jgi:hypothetical protein
VVIDHADRLHEGVADGRAHEPEAPRAEVLGQGVGFGRAGGDIAHGAAGLGDGGAVDKAPGVDVKRSELVLHGEKRTGVVDGGGDLEAVADDARIAEQGGPAAGVEPCHAGGVEVLVHLAVAIALAEDGLPTQAGLGALEDEELEQGAVVVDRHAPLEVVVRAGEVGSGPGAGWHIGPAYGADNPASGAKPVGARARGLGVVYLTGAP